VSFDRLADGLRGQGYAGWLVVEQDVLPGMGTPLESAKRNRAFVAGLGV
jgi:inosose dehydratase